MGTMEKFHNRILFRIISKSCILLHCHREYLPLKQNYYCKLVLVVHVYETRKTSTDYEKEISAFENRTHNKWSCVSKKRHEDNKIVLTGIKNRKMMCIAHIRS